MKLYNTKTRQKESFKPIHKGEVRMYNCGPTVYSFPTIGNWRTFILADSLRRVLEFQGYDVHQVMNITDVGHMTMTEEKVSKVKNVEITDDEEGIDRMEKAAKREGKTVHEVAEYYTNDFLVGLKKLGIKTPHEMPHAADDFYIQKQIELIQRLEKKGFTYQTDEAIYFDTSKDPKYGEFSRQLLNEKIVGARDEVHVDNDKKKPWDFRLWQFSKEPRQMEWKSPWGVGFPGWHIECSAMSIHHLGVPFDIHTGGVDHIPVHHENEIAQTRCAMGKDMANYWVHGEFLLVDGGRMGKSLGNAYTLNDIEIKGFSPRDLRYFYHTAHYRTKQNFTWQALGAARSARKSLVAFSLSQSFDNVDIIDHRLFQRFNEAISDDLHFPQAMAIVHETVKSNIPMNEKFSLLRKYESVLGIGLFENEKIKLSKKDEEQIRQILLKRDALKLQKNYVDSDKLRNEIEERYGVKVIDTPNGSDYIID